LSLVALLVGGGCFAPPPPLSPGTWYLLVVGGIALAVGSWQLAVGVVGSGSW
jgi:hypothetical protein